MCIHPPGPLNLHPTTHLHKHYHVAPYSIPGYQTPPSMFLGQVGLRGHSRLPLFFLHSSLLPPFTYGSPSI